MDRLILRSTGQNRPEVLILPTAAVEAPWKAASNGVQYFSRLGARASELMVLSVAHANDEDTIKNLSFASVVYFTGGSPAHLLAILHGTKLLDRLRKMITVGVVVGGSSAGAMVMGSMMRLPTTGEWVKGLDIATGLAVLPHHEGQDPEMVASELTKRVPPGLTIFGIEAQTCCFGSPGNWRVLGSGKVTVYRDGSWATYSGGRSFLLRD
jgi:cyanophycinase